MSEGTLLEGDSIVFDALVRNLAKAQDELRDTAGRLDHTSLSRLCYRYFSRAYDAHMEATNHYGAMRQLLDHLKKYIGRTYEGARGTNVFDPSCGTGEALLYLADHFNQQGLEVIANDPSPDMLDKARSKLTGKIQRIRFTDYDVRCIPKEERFGTILCSQSVHGFPADERGSKRFIVQKLLDALEPRGFIVSLEEWPPTATPSPYLPAGVPELLGMIETPIEIDLDGGKWGNLFELCGARFVQGNGMRIDKKHTLYGLVYQKQ